MGVAGNDVLQKTADEIAADSELPWDEVHGSSVVVTGSTGLIGSHLVRSLLASNDHHDRDISLILPVRNVEKAQSLFGAREDAKIVPWSLGEEFKCPGPVDYFVHAACGTSSKAFSAAPATTIMQIVAGANEMLKSALAAECKKFVFLSTMEVYGEVEGVACEDNLGKLDPMVVRNSYPEAKRLAECLCASCASFPGIESPGKFPPSGYAGSSPVSRMWSRSASSRTGTPRLWALVSLEPAASPATT